ncbi:NTP transferase domain-containing protein [Myxococcota bacterium]|nr:NTP transferase domain-containing protein [Myxococcota bacterium]MBU1413736.1 NTP transferase domain-containing protein [Myxococcota bacterium]
MDVITITHTLPGSSPPLVLMLAAGAGVRMGGPKVFARVQGSAFATHIADTLHTLGWPALWVLRTQSQIPILADIINYLPDVCINTNLDGDMLSSIQAALSAPQALFQATYCIWPVDFPLIRPETLQQLANELGSCDGAVPVNLNCTGHPLIVKRHTLCRWISSMPHDGLRQAMFEQPACIRQVPVLDPGPFQNLNTPDDCLAACPPPRE